MSIYQKVSGFQGLIFCPPPIWGGCEKHRVATRLVCNNVQLNDTSRSGSGLLADNVEHFAHQFLNRDTNEQFTKWLSIHFEIISVLHIDMI